MFRPFAKPLGKWQYRVLLIAFPAALLFLSLLIGRYGASPVMVLKVFFSKLFFLETEYPPILDTVLFKVRLPRILAAMLIGGGLSVSGAAFQGLFRNPLVSPFILGVASGAGFGASLGILLFDSALSIQLLAFIFGAVAVGASWGMTRLYRTSSSLVLVLAGVIVGTFFSALLSLIKYVADPDDKLPMIVFWLMGSLARIGPVELFHLTGPIFMGVGALFAIRRRINLLTLGEEEARALGVEVGRMRTLIVLAATLVTASAVSVSGIIGWVGLVIPHLARMISGPDYRRLLPVAFSMGACYLLLIDDLARNLTAAEIPLGILKATVGAPIFAIVLKKSSLGWS